MLLISSIVNVFVMSLLFDAAIITDFELSTKSFLKIFFLVSRQSSINSQFGIVKAVFARQLFFRQSSRYRQLIVNRSSIVNRQSSIVNSSSTCVRACVYVCVYVRALVCVCVCVCGVHACRKVRNETTKKSFLKIFEKKFCSLKNGYTFA